MWQAVVLLCACLTATSAFHFDPSPMHDFNMKPYLSAREWTPVGIQVVDFDVDPDAMADHPAEDEMEDKVHGVTTMDECSVTMAKIAALPAYLREPIVSLAAKSMENLGTEDPTSEDHLHLEKIDLDEHALENEDDYEEMILSDEKFKKLEDSLTAEDVERFKRKLSAYLSEDGLTEEEIEKVALNSHDLAKSFMIFRIWWQNNKLGSLRPRCLVGANVCAFKWRRLLFKGRTYCCRHPKGLPRIFQRGNKRVCNC